MITSTIIIQLSLKNFKYLVNRGHNLKSAEQCFNKVGKILLQEAKKKKKKLRKTNDLVLFSASRNFHGPNINEVINKNIHLLPNNDDLRQLYLKRAIIVPSKKEKELGTVTY